MIEAFLFSFLTKGFIGSQRLQVAIGMIVEGEGIQAEVHIGFPTFTGAKGSACLDVVDGGRCKGSRGCVGINRSSDDVNVRCVVGAHRN
jgi:hypothetical protein